MSHRSYVLAPLLLLSVPAGSLGCIYRSKVEGRQIQTPRSYSRQLPDRVAPRPTGRWWVVFADPQLDRLMQLAFAESLSLEQARARLQQAHTQVTAARAGWLPTINGSVELARSKRVFSEAFQFSTTTLDVSLGASYEFDIWGRTRYGYQSAEHSVLAAQQELRAAYITLASQLAEAYYGIVAARAQLVLLERTIKSRENQLDLVKRRYQAGVVTALDVYQAQSNLAAARATRAQFIAQLEVGEHTLATLVGRFPGRVRSGSLEQLPEQVAALPPGAPGQLLLRRPDLRAAYERLLATDAQVGAALAEHFPRLSFSGSIGHSWVDFSPAGLIWGLIGNLTAPLFQGGRIQAEYARRRAVLREQLAAFEERLRVAVKEVEDALSNGRAQTERVAHLQASVEAAENALRLALDQYAQGLQSYLNVLTSEQALFSARSELIAARRELVVTRIQLARALGGSWMDEEIERNATQRQSRKP